jgi:hypothetical protein
MILTYDKRQARWEWCRNYVDTEAIYRVDETHPMLPGKNPKGRYTFQFYLRRATFNPQFAISVGMLFWDHFTTYGAAVQIAPEPSGPRSVLPSRPRQRSASRSMCSPRAGQIRWPG